MASEPLPDHYKALGVDKNADAAIIKATYRKLVLKCHPDKVTDPALKEQKQHEFHRIQEAYEVLVDKDKRADYEAHLTLEALRKEKAARASAAPSAEKTARFDVRTSGGASFTATGPSRYATEERRPSRTYDDDDRYYDDRDRTRSKYDTYPAYPKGSSSPRSKESSSKSSRPVASDRTRSERTKTRDKEARNDRKFVSVESESSADEKARYEADYKRRSAEDEARKHAAESRRKAEDRRSYEDSHYDASPTARKLSVQKEEALRYQHKSRGQVEAEMNRPSPTRTSSRDYYGESRSSRKEVRPEAVRRSSAARPKERSSTSGRERDRGFPEIVDWSEHRSPPTFKHSSSSPANIELPRTMPQRAYTDSSREHRRADNSPPPAFHRSATMPSVPHSSSSSRRKEATTLRPSGLRETVTPEHSSPEREAFPTVPQPQSSSSRKFYHYPTPGGSVPFRPEDLAGSSGPHRTILREPERHRNRSPSPLSRPPMGANRPVETTPQYVPKATVPPPSMNRSSSSRNISPPRGADERGRTRPLYGEVGVDSQRSRGRQTSFSPGSVQFSRKYGPEDVRWAPRSRENDREYASKPTLGRTATYVY